MNSKKLLLMRFQTVHLVHMGVVVRSSASHVEQQVHVIQRQVYAKMVAQDWWVNDKCDLQVSKYSTVLWVKFKLMLILVYKSLL